MAGTVSFGGIGSGIDTESIVNGLIGASRAGLQPVRTRAASAKSAISTISDISSMLSRLKSAAEALDTDSEISAFKGTSANAAMTVTANPSATAGSYNVKVVALAAESRNVSQTYGTDATALNITADLGITIGGGATQNVSIASGDTLNGIADKINALDARVEASVIFDGTNYRLHVKGQDTGTANAVSFSGTGATELAMNGVGNQLQAAQNANVQVDGITVTAGTNTIGGAIPGVTLNLLDTTASTFKIKVETDPDAMKGKLKEFVSAYNAVVDKIHREAGHGATRAKSADLAGDSSLRTVTSGLGNVMLQTLDGDNGKTLASVGVRLNNDGTIRLDEAKYAEALAANPTQVREILAGSATGSGVMDVMRTVVEGYTTTGTGLLYNKKQALQDRADRLDGRIQREEARLATQADLLRRQFTAMDEVVANNKSTLDYLVRMSIG